MTNGQSINPATCETGMDRFMFSCHRGLSCFTRCCVDVNIFLTPFDVLRMKNNLKISSEEFLADYTIILIAEGTGLPVVLLKMDEESKKCPFVSEEGCKIYTDRPWSCRMYPLDRGEEGEYRFVDNPGCLGLNERQEWSVSTWMAEQGVDVYDQMEGLFNEISESVGNLKDRILNPKIREIFFMACYNVDKFRRFIFESSFLNVFDIEKEVVERIKADEVELMKFGFQWVKFGIVERQTLKIREEALEAKRKELSVKE